jgi:hypothetical protein
MLVPAHPRWIRTATPKLPTMIDNRIGCASRLEADSPQARAGRESMKIIDQHKIGDLLIVL